MSRIFIIVEQINTDNGQVNRLYTDGFFTSVKDVEDAITAIKLSEPKANISFMSLFKSVIGTIN